MATSPNYLWSEPDNSSLVKDGAQAMRTLGDAIDTSVWNVGMGQAGKNAVTNSAFQIFQRGTSISVAASTSPYVSDRWQASVQASQASTYSQQATSDTTNLPDIQYCIRVQRNSGQTGTGTINLAQSFESINTRRFTGKTVTLSFYARRGANYSQTSNALGAYLYTGTGTDQNVISGYTGGAIPLAVPTTLTTTWQRFSASVTLSSSVTEMGIRFQYDPTGTAGAADYFEVTGVQLEAGSIATPFQTASGGSIQQELAMCQRYYCVLGEGDFYGSYYNSSSQFVLNGRFPVTMRTTPTSTLPSGTTTNGVQQVGIANYNASSLGYFAGKTNSFSFTGTASGGTQYAPVAWLSSTTSFTFSAEI